MSDTLAMQYLTPLTDTYLPWSDASLNPSDIVRVLNEIVVNNRSCILECGAGMSTFYIAKILQEREGHLYTIEHDKQWAEIIEQSLKKAGLDKVVSLIIAPLKPTQLSINQCDWYDEEVVERNISHLKIDLLLVDGPPAFKEPLKYARYPAVPYFMKFMAEDYTIILDDADRAGEKEILSKWEKQLGIRFKKHITDGHTAIGRSKQGFMI